MKQVRQHLSDKQKQLAGHTFFSRLERNEPFQRAMSFAPGLAFWVFVFQDVLRLNESRVRDPALRRIARHHRAEDRGHELWFIEDLAELDPRPRDFGWLFARQQASTRDAAYALVSEVYRANDDHVRVTLLLTLESAGHVFFENLARYVARNDAGKRLKYFSHDHLEVEKGHELFEEEMMKVLEVALVPSVRTEAIALIDRCYEAFDQLFSGLEARIVRAANGSRSTMPPMAPKLASGDDE